MSFKQTFAVVGLAVALNGMVVVGQAQAFGDRCFDPMVARGQAANTMRGAWASASAAWERAVARRHGAKYANWMYSGDRTFDCSWNAGGDRIVCVAEATPCGRK
jgi:hypothetical protein